MRAPPTEWPANPKPPPRPAKPAPPPPTCPPKPPPLPPPPPGPAFAASVIAGIVRSKIAAVARPLIKRALAGVAIFSIAVRAGRTLKWRMVLPQGLQFVSRRKPQPALRQKEGERSIVYWRRQLSWWP